MIGHMIVLDYICICVYVLNRYHLQGVQYNLVLHPLHRPRPHDPSLRTSAPVASMAMP